MNALNIPFELLWVMQSQKDKPLVFKQPHEPGQHPGKNVKLYVIDRFDHRNRIPFQRRTESLDVGNNPAGTLITTPACVRYRFAGRPRKLTLQGGVSIEQARKLAADALFQVSQGNDPAAAKAAKHGA